MVCEDGRCDLLAQTDKIETRVTMMMTGARIVLIVCGVVGFHLAVMAGAALADARVALLVGLTGVVLAGQMAIAATALRGHLHILRLIRTEFDLVHQRMDDHARFERRIAATAKDELRQRRH